MKLTARFDLLITNQLLYQLSYTSVKRYQFFISLLFPDDLYIISHYFLFVNTFSEKN